MSALGNQLARRAAELLADGEWHNYEQVFNELAKLVPPGFAIRENEKARRGSGGPAARKKVRPAEELIESGRRMYVRDVLSNPRNYESTKATRPRDPERQIRMIAKPRALVLDAYSQATERLHLRLDTLQDQVDALRKYLAEIGHAEAAERLAPQENDGQD